MRYTHDCKQCVFLGEYGKYDLYACVTDDLKGSMIARYGDMGSEYISLSIDYIEGIVPLFRAYDRYIKRLNEAIEAGKKWSDMGGCYVAKTED